MHGCVSGSARRKGQQYEDLLAAIEKAGQLNMEESIIKRWREEREKEKEEERKERKKEKEEERNERKRESAALLRAISNLVQSGAPLPRGRTSARRRERSQSTPPGEGDESSPTRKRRK